uniref:AlNc14C499G11933 protein n=1 Tax=Albugo laibachii Nc14 TaxID=890382 RepID=F0X0I8_9STRA|nr:AlNc14C499G11933 [Albugo laibachii Nc14]|eukprot:CCA27279.1 AlNc14C499G11933 [Albugo laibachii Nc14]
MWQELVVDILNAVSELIPNLILEDRETGAQIHYSIPPLFRLVSDQSMKNCSHPFQRDNTRASQHRSIRRHARNEHYRVVQSYTIESSKRHRSCIQSYTIHGTLLGAVDGMPLDVGDAHPAVYQLGLTENKRNKQHQTN